jgi:agmatinase
LLDTKVFDGGDLELCFGNTRKALDEIKEFASYVLSENKMPIIIGGEHLVTLGGVEAAAEMYNDLCIIHFDAHADLRDEYLGEKLSHACVIRRSIEVIGGKVYQFGIRSGDKEEFEYAKENTVMRRFNFDGIKEACAEIGDKPVYFTIDLDVLDSAVFPGTGTPEAGGVSFMDLIGAIDSLSGLNIIAADITELCPVYDQSGISSATACKILRELILALSK